MHQWWGYQEIAPREPEKTPLQRCKELYIAIRLEQKKTEPNPDTLSTLNCELYKHNDATRAAAFDAVVDEQGW